MVNEIAARQPVPGVYTSWTVEAVRGALYAHESGDFSRSAMLVDHIWRDDRFYSTLQTRILAALTLPFKVDPPEGYEDNARAKALAKNVKGWWFDSIPEAVLGEVLKWEIPMGFAIGENVWKYDEEAGEIRLAEHKIHHPQFIRWSEQKKKFLLRTLDQGEIEVNPGDGRFVLWTSSASERPWMVGAVRALAIPFLIRTFNRRDWARRGEVESLGVRKAGVPADPDDKVAAKFFAAVAKLGSETTLKLPPGYTFEIEAVDTGAATSFERLNAHCDTAITLTILGQNLTTQIEGGSYAAATVHARVQLDRITSDVAMLATIARNQIVVWWGRYNFANFKRALTPWPRYDATPAEDIQKVAQGFLTLGQALLSLDRFGVDVTPLLERFGLEKTKKTAQADTSTDGAPHSPGPNPPPQPPPGEQMQP